LKSSNSNNPHERTVNKTKKKGLLHRENGVLTRLPILRLLSYFDFNQSDASMKKALSISLIGSFILCTSSYSQTNIDAGPKNEVFRQTTLIPSSGNLSDPWEITYGPDDSLWVTEAKGYKVKKVSPVNGGSRTVLDISFNSTFLPVGDRPFNAQFSLGSNNPQGGLMGLAIHPDFMKPVNPKRFIFLAYVHTYNSTAPGNGGVFYTNRLVRFTYNTSTNRFDSPVQLCDTLPGSSDHNSGRLIIAPVGDSMYLFYAAGDMGAGQFGNESRLNKAQNVLAYEGKILRFRINHDNDAGLYNRWIPSGIGTDANPFNGAAQNAVWATGIRNNQGFTYANGRLYGSSHGPFSDDELYVLEAGKNYGHPIVIGFSGDGNYNNAKAGDASSNLPLISTEAASVTSIGASNYRDPFFTFYSPAMGTTGTPGTVQYIYSQFSGGNYDNSAWPSEAPSGIDMYTASLIPGWKNSLLIGSLKGGRILRINMNAAGTGSSPNGNTSDTNTLFRSVNRFRDMAISPDGRSIFTVIDSSSTTSGPTTTNPIISACPGCLQKYTFLGYNANGSSPFASNIPTSIAIAAGTANQCENANTVVINSANNNTNIWVPITDMNSRVVAEIYANGNDLDTVRTSFYKNTGTVREDGAHHLYLDRNITITPETQPSSNVRIRLYISDAEFNSLNSAVNSLSQPSGVSTISNLGIFKNNNNVCGSAIGGGLATAVTAISRVAHGSSGYVLQSNTLSSFSSFYFANSSLTTLPVQMVSFTGVLNNNAALLNWTTSTEVNTANFEIERSIDGSSYDKIGVVAANGNSTNPIDYLYTDNDAITLSAPTIYYRLKIVDRDGASSYSNTVAISLAEMPGRVTVFPNPLADKANVTIGALTDGQVYWKILDNAGRTIQQNTAQLKKGRNNLVINTNKLSAGIYYLRVTGAGIDQNIKLQKL
jgi:trimeric autotransporter adhesin